MQNTTVHEAQVLYRFPTIYDFKQLDYIISMYYNILNNTKNIKIVLLMKEIKYITCPQS